MIRTHVVENGWAVKITVTGHDAWAVDRIREMYRTEFKPFMKRDVDTTTVGFEMLFDPHAEVHACAIQPTGERLRGMAMAVMCEKHGNSMHYRED